MAAKFTFHSYGGARGTFELLPASDKCLTAHKH